MVLLLIGIPVTLAGTSAHADPPAPCPEKTSSADKLTRGEEALLRNLVYKKGLGISTPVNGPNAGHRMVPVLIPVAELHKKKRVATLRLLLEIVRGGRPEDALTAAGWAVALEEGGFAAVAFFDWPAHLFDDGDDGGKRSGRELAVKWVSELLAKAEKQGLGKP
jgi:hypothetical protein